MSEEKKSHRNQFIYFIGIEGIGMSSLARFAVKNLYYVYGSDTSLANGKSKIDGIIAAYPDHKAENIAKFVEEARSICEDPQIAIVYSSIIEAKNPEYLEAQKYAFEEIVTLQSRGKFLSDIFNKASCAIGIAGCHGKTSTTAMIGYLLKNYNPTIFNGGLMANFDDKNFAHGSSDLVVAEIDESDGTLVFFSPTVSIILNIDREHIVNYNGSMDALLAAYKQYALNTRENGILMICSEDEYCDIICTSIQYMRPDINLVLYKKSEFDIFNKAIESLRESPLRIYGVTRWNAGIATKIAMLYETLIAENLSNASSIESEINAEKMVIARNDNSINNNFANNNERYISLLSDFRGVSRRFENVGMYNGAYLVDDYGHHPLEILSTSKMAQCWKDDQSANGKKINKMYCIIQPHRYSRFMDMHLDFLDVCHEICGIFDAVLIMDIHAANEDFAEMLEIYKENFSFPSMVNNQLHNINPSLWLGDIISSYYQQYSKKNECIEESRCDELGNGMASVANKPIHVAGSNSNIVEFVKSNAKKGDLFIFMGAGNITYIPRQIAKE